MHRVRVYNSPVAAMNAVIWLWQSRIVAAVMAGKAEDPIALAMGSSRAMGSYEVHVAEKSKLDEARALLDEFDTSCAEMDTDWEFESEHPDLSLLDSALAPDCPSCGDVLPMDEELASCPWCSASVSVVDELVSAHGPEVLDACFAQSSMMPDDMLQEAPLQCPKCRYVLAGLPLEGTCPECGAGYRKHDIVRHWFG